MREERGIAFAKRPRLVVCDIDNTLVVKHQPLTARAREVIRRLESKGVLFGLASGRGTDALRQLAEEWDVCPQLYIGYNGSEMYDGIFNEKVSSCSMKAEWIREILEFMEPFDTNPSADFDGIQYTARLDARTLASANYVKSSRPVHVVETLSEFWQTRREAPKLMFRVREEEMPAIEETVRSHRSPYYKGVKTEFTMMEFVNRLAGKGDLTERFCRAHGISMEDVWAFGDMSNDVDMLIAAGTGVCMKNGSEDAKAAADYTTDLPCEEDGWAAFMEAYCPLG